MKLIATAFLGALALSPSAFAQAAPGAGQATDPVKATLESCGAQNMVLQAQVGIAQDRLMKLEADNQRLIAENAKLTKDLHKDAAPLAAAKPGAPQKR